jgi:hypothetical protein
MMRDCRKSLCLVLVLVAILLASMLLGCGDNDKETTQTPMPTETPAEVPTYTPAPQPAETPAVTPAEVPEESTPLPGTPISKDKPMIIQSISTIVGEGEASFIEGEKSGTLRLTINGTLPVNESKQCLGCFETIIIGPNLNIPTNVFTEQDIDKSTPVGVLITDYGPTGVASASTQYFMTQLITGDAFLYFELETVTIAQGKDEGKELTAVKDPLVIDYIKFYEAVLEIPIDAEDAEFIVSGPDGATLKKVENGFLLLEGEAYLVD